MECIKHYITVGFAKMHTSVFLVSKVINWLLSLGVACLVVVFGCSI